MSQRSATVVKLPAPARDPLEEISKSFVRHLRAGNFSPNTIESYAEALRQLRNFLAKERLPQEPRRIKREHLEAFVNDLLAKFKPATAANRFRALQSFCRWLVDEGEIAESPMAHMKVPAIPEHTVPVLTEAQLRALLQLALLVAEAAVVQACVDGFHHGPWDTRLMLPWQSPRRRESVTAEPAGVAVETL